MSPTDQDLFETDPGSRPLAARMRPRSIDEYVGQQHILAPGRLLRRAIQGDMLSSIILSGPPGSGKTTLAEVIANTTRGRFRSLNAVLSGVKEVRQAIAEAEDAMKHQGRRTILFVDEVHRWNKAQQDALLPWVENGTVILVGATTENPYFEVNSALVSRSRIFLLKKLSEEELAEVARSALKDKERGYGRYRVVLEDDALEHIVQVSDGDARVLLNALQLAVETTPERFPPPPGEEIRVSLSVAEDSIQRKALLYDREGDYHFDSISAFIKSLRGSDPDAALYWMARMIAAGEDPRYILRRMLIMAAEDIGLADPQALVVANAAATAFDRVGMPEGQFHLAEAALYLATAKKSNTTLSYFDALAAVEKEREGEVPRHLRDGNRDAAGMGHGAGYLYPHAYADHWVEQRYLPESLEGRVFYEPSTQGYEATVRNDVLRRRELVMAAVSEDTGEDVYAVAPRFGDRGSWYRRLTSKRVERLAKIQEHLLEAAEVAPHHRVLILGVAPQLLLPEVHRRAHSGRVVVVRHAAGSDAETALLHRAAAEVPEIERPLVLEPGAETTAGHQFERIVGRNYLAYSPEPRNTLAELFETLAPGGRIVLAESVPRRSTGLSQLLRELSCPVEERLITALEAAEQTTFASAEGSGGLNPGVLEVLSSGPEGRELRVDIRSYPEKRVLEGPLLSQWLSPESSGPLARALGTHLEEEEQEALLDAAGACLRNREIEWSFAVAYLTAEWASG
ncbi:MAG: AAA family ATPase [Spirochaetota bacterium]